MLPHCRSPQHSTASGQGRAKRPPSFSVVTRTRHSRFSFFFFSFCRASRTLGTVIGTFRNHGSAGIVSVLHNYQISGRVDPGGKERRPIQRDGSGVINQSPPPPPRRSRGRNHVFSRHVMHRPFFLTRGSQVASRCAGNGCLGILSPQTPRTPGVAPHYPLQGILMEIADPAKDPAGVLRSLIMRAALSMDGHHLIRSPHTRYLYSETAACVSMSHVAALGGEPLKTRNRSADVVSLRMAGNLVSYIFPWFD
ncbi:hypothetical protein EDB87DRAFT_1639032 [Lactarius vividus]|nr:hypothetical protein EDB87DRAFT_1639032 [Lactarius vividus]